MHMMEDDDDDSSFECDADMAPLIKRPLDDIEQNLTKDGVKRKCTPRLVVCHAFLLLMALALIFTGLLFLPWSVESMYGYVIHHVFVLDPNSRFFPEWQQPSLPIYQSVYFFDIQNPDDLIKGQRPKVVEKGPYVYRMELARDNVTFHDNDTVSFLLRYRYYFEEDRSVGPETDTVTAINSPLLTTAHIMKNYQFLVRTAIRGLLYELDERVIVTRTISEMMWGYYEPLLVVAKQFQTVPPAFESGRFGYFVGFNTTYVGQFNVFTGKENGSLINHIERVDGKKSLPFWWSDEANEIAESTDGSLYHPNVEKTDTLQLYQPPLCRSVSYDFVKDSSYEGIPLLKFSLSPFTYMNATAFPPNEGFCSGQRELCGPSGVMRQDPCHFGSPVAISNPHFLGGQQTLFDDVDGLSPNSSLHDSYMEVEPKTGIPFVMKFRVQINMFVKPVGGIRETEEIREMYLPLLWIEQSVEANDQIVAEFKLGFVEVWNIIVGVEWLLFSIGIIIILLLLVKTARVALKSGDVEKDVEDFNGNGKSRKSQDAKITSATQREKSCVKA
ncbi:scavenger receptor class B member 1 [Strongylocentrotus purpuratus]|uniref:Scavenger receptor class B member 1 n=1 Tax=Strongylocentrotus purpuratus TaxID=7668 RepID=A0A7M7SXR4_STRPU|nr:scavenger receptor class B member 1 [Strongylocentrotus purpuratus]XP_030839055.1 scavenger receptor class B member 1 [Strongylocentrotus purpuratus]